MDSERIGASKQALTFEAWKSLLRSDCVLQGKLLEFQALGNDVLEILWQRGIEPTVTAIVEDGATDKAPGEGRSLDG